MPRIKLTVDQVEDFICEKEIQIKNLIKSVGSTAIANITGLKKQYLSGVATNQIKMSYNKILELAKKLLDA